VTALLVAGAALLGLLCGFGVSSAYSRRSWRSGSDTPHEDGASVPELHGRGRAAVVVGTAVLFGVLAWRFGPAWELPAYLAFAASAVLLTVVDLRHTVLPNRVVLPSIGIGAALLTVAAAAESAWPDLLRAGLAAVALFAVFLVLALISPRSLGMGDVKLAALVGLFLGWLSWGAVLVGAAAGFVVQALIALVLLASRRIGLRGELPFGPAMLAGAVLAIGWSGLLVR
jgi:leader peptidase (prepilin peptidase)/N-methyltransferase